MRCPSASGCESHGAIHSVRAEEISALVQQSGALDRARRRAHEYAAQAKASLDGIGDPEFRRALLTVPDFVLERES